MERPGSKVKLYFEENFLVFLSVRQVKSFFLIHIIAKPPPTSM